MKDLISIVVPIYNVEDYLGECIDSILNQTYTNFEVLLIDDGSTDSSGGIAKSYSQNQSKVFYYFKKNGGLSDARNYGIDKAKGKYITFIDSDDFIETEYLEKLYGAIIKYNADISIGTFYNYREKKIDIITSDYYEKLMSREEIIFNMYQAKDNYYTSLVTAWGKLYKLELFENIRYPFGKKHEDEFTTYKLYLESEKIIYINIPIYTYRIREGSIINSSFSLNSLDIVEMFEERIKILKNAEFDVNLSRIKYLNILNKLKYLLKKNNYKEELKEIESKYEEHYYYVKNTVDIKTKLLLFLMKRYGNYYYRYCKKI